MDKKSEGFWPVVFLLFGLLALALHSLYEDLLKAALLRWLGGFLGVGEAELMSRLTEMAVPIAGAIAVMSFFYWFLKREFAKQSPFELFGHIEGVVSGGTGPNFPESFPALFIISITNKGERQSIASQFEVTALTEGRRFTGNVLAFPRDFIEMQAPPINNGPPRIVRYPATEDIIQKAAVPIPSGGLLVGVLFSLFKPGEILPGTELTVSFKDAAFNAHQAKMIFQTEPAAAMMSFPGLKQEFRRS